MAETETEAAVLVEHTVALRDAMVKLVPQWVENVVLARAPAPDAANTRDAVGRLQTEARNVTIPNLTSLFDTDIDEQPSSPLEIVRTLVPSITQELHKLHAPTVPRDQHRMEMLADDAYAVTPATFSDIDESLHPLGLAWGAAKAHVHLRRHGQKESPPVVVVFAPELGDRSRFDAYNVTHVRSAGTLVEFSESAEPDLIIVDLDRTSAPADFRLANAHVVGFGSHVDTDRHEAALDAGFDAVVARSVFFRRLPELLAPVAKLQR
ncbi:MAG: hypothetical protein ACN4GZ_04315 [Acidimicrobiales bacterium]